MVTCHRRERPLEVKFDYNAISNLFDLLDEVTRLLRDHQQNRELIRRLGKRYYQVVYPIQVNTQEVVYRTYGQECFWQNVFKLCSLLNKDKYPFFVK